MGREDVGGWGETGKPTKDCCPSAGPSVRPQKKTTLLSVLAVRSTRHAPLDTAPCWTGGATST